jgi:homoserine kinase
MSSKLRRSVTVRVPATSANMGPGFDAVRAVMAGRVAARLGKGAGARLLCDGGRGMPVPSESHTHLARNAPTAVAVAGTGLVGDG